MISVNNLSVHFTGAYIFDDVSFLINDRDRLGLVGKNGAGKTTLLNIIAKVLYPEKGNVVIPSGKTIGYLRQEMNPESDKTILEEAGMAFKETLELENEINRLTSEITNRTDYESKEYFKLINCLNESNERFHFLGGLTMDEDIEKALLGLGFLRKDFNRQMAEFSSGWQMRVELAKILLAKPDFILLDEPTNHLDIESIQWLEDFLAKYPGAVILVTHDRAFLDNVTNRTIEISLGKIYDYKASYSDYEIMMAARREKEIAGFNNQQKQIARIERFIERFRYKNTKSRQVQSRIKLLEKMDKVEIDETDNSIIHFRFPTAPHSGKVSILAENLSQSYGDHNVLKNLNFSVSKGEKIAFVGKNGEGKSTLSRVLVGELAHDGELILGHKVSIGYYAQNQYEMLDPDKTVFQTIDDEAVGEMRTRVRGLLGSFLFSGEDIDKKVKVLSGGEKSRLSLAKMLLKPVSLLVLDEPTNHLDMRSKDILKNALLQYDGTLIIVSHDRDFLTGLTNKVFEFRNKNIKEYLGDVTYFLEVRKLENLRQLEKKKSEKETSIKKTFSSENKLSYEKRKQTERNRRKLNNQIKKAEEKIELLEKKITEIDAKLTDPENYQNEITSGDLFKKYDTLKKYLKEAMNKWEELVGEMEKIGSA